MRLRRFTSAGLTLMEFIIVSSLLTFIGAVLLDFLIRQADFIQVSEARGDLRSRAQLSISDCVNELRHATRAGGGSPPDVAIPPPPDNTRVRFYRPVDQDANGMIINAAGAIEWDALNPIEYQYVPAARQLIRVQGAATRVIANDVVSAGFEDQTIDPTLLADEVRVRFTSQRITPRGRTLSTTVNAIVKLRN